MAVNYENVLPDLMVQVTPEFQIRTNRHQFELVHLRENPPGLNTTWSHTAISLGKFSNLQLLGRHMAQKISLYYSPVSQEAATTQAFIHSMNQVAQAVASAVVQVPDPVVFVEPEPPAPEPTTEPEVVPDLRAPEEVALVPNPQRTRKRTVGTPKATKPTKGAPTRKKRE